MSRTMWRVAKHEGVGNIQLEQVPVPDPGPGEVLVRTKASLISRGSELWNRYIKENAVDPAIMGYSTTGVVEVVGEGVSAFAPGDRVVSVAPHAEYSLASTAPEAVRGRISPLADGVGHDVGTFHPLCTSAFGWTAAAGIAAHHTVAILGQGIVGNLVTQFARRFGPAQRIAVDALDLRCRLAREVHGPEVPVVDASTTDPVESVRHLTGGRGADIVIDCVGGRAGLASFDQAQRMLGAGGLLHLIGLYHGGPLPLDASRMMGKRLLGGYPPTTDRAVIGRGAMAAMACGEVTIAPLVTHRFPGGEAKRAFDLLYEHPDEAMGVLLEWA